MKTLSLSFIQFALPLVLGLGGAYTGVKVSQAQAEVRLATIEQRQAIVIGSLVPRAEHEAHWDEQRRQLEQLRQDIRDLREYLMKK